MDVLVSLSVLAGMSPMVSACCADGLCVENVVVFRKPGTTRYCGRGIRQLWSIAAFFGTSRSPQRMQVKSTLLYVQNRLLACGVVLLQASTSPLSLFQPPVSPKHCKDNIRSFPEQKRSRNPLVRTSLQVFHSLLCECISW